MLSLFLAAAITTAKLPLIEVPATQRTSDTFVVFISGDGGWAKIDKEISKVFAENGMPVVGLNALQYFWTKRTPEAAARDLQSILETYLTRWKKERVLFVGYSRGADVLPFMINRLPAALRSKTRLIALLGPSPRVEFEFHIGDWMRTSSKEGFAVKPEVDKLSSQNIVCLFGEDDKDSLCPLVSGPRMQTVMLPGAHHFDGGYQKLAGIILLNLK